MIDTQFLSVFLSGIATAYFALSAYYLFRRRESSRLQIVVGYIFLQWTALNLKDFIFTQYDASSQVLQDVIVLLDGTSLIGYTLLLYELIRPRWATWRKALGMLMAYVPFFVLYAVWPSQTVINCYLVCLFIVGTVIFLVWLKQGLKYARYIRDNFSNIDKIDISWLKVVALFFVICQLIWVAISIIRIPLADSLYYASSIILWQYTLERIIHQKAVDMEQQIIGEEFSGIFNEVKQSVFHNTLLCSILREIEHDIVKQSDSQNTCNLSLHPLSLIDTIMYLRFHCFPFLHQHILWSNELIKLHGDECGKQVTHNIILVIQETTLTDIENQSKCLVIIPVTDTTNSLTESSIGSWINSLYLIMLLEYLLTI